MYAQMLTFVKEQLKQNEHQQESYVKFPFRRRFEHTERVFLWAKRLLSGEDPINEKAVLVAAIFHDVGLASGGKAGHGERSAGICERYLKDRGYEPEFIDFVCFLIRKHSQKELLSEPSTPRELVILMEADLLDETGALGIVWDCMARGLNGAQSFREALEEMQTYSVRDMEENPMVTSTAKRFWHKKQQLTKDFICHLKVDLGLD